MRIAEIAQGAISTRVLVATTEGHYRIAHSARHAQHYPQPGWVEHDPLELLAASRHASMPQALFMEIFRRAVLLQSPDMPSFPKSRHGKT
ncbi:hypothetical protein [Mesorhizobium retamae]|uniref:Uncharacterized protein n=1 Tax=Mesorhizobium retamae TaxID=2912854 RepID=A0ABS9QD79_9HYPH|nr:hypothetical protein [Mesorhizobium sp. IRAMC:0171]MCG7505362.1 hypothetical protein [Mesorhizobium sp. IRAMC:0171]